MAVVKLLCNRLRDRAFRRELGQWKDGFTWATSCINNGVAEADIEAKLSLDYGINRQFDLGAIDALAEYNRGKAKESNTVGPTGLRGTG